MPQSGSTRFLSPPNLSYPFLSFTETIVPQSSPRQRRPSPSQLPYRRLLPPNLQTPLLRHQTCLRLRWRRSRVKETHFGGTSGKTRGTEGGCDEDCGEDVGIADEATGTDRE